jgi:ribose transport system permease protein
VAETKVQAALEAPRDRARDARARAARARVLARVAPRGAFVVLVLAVNVFSHGAFLTPATSRTSCARSPYNAILAVGQTFVIITAGIDLSVGSLDRLTAS